MKYIYDFFIDLSIIEEVKQQALKLPLINNSLNKVCYVNEKIQCFFNERLFDRIDECLACIREENYISEVDLVITESWVTHTMNYQKHHKHHHTNSIVSGILYLTDHPKATTNFYYKNPYGFVEEYLPHLKPEKREIVDRVSPVPGKLILFPSNIKHDTSTTINSKEPRMTFCFNAAFSNSNRPSEAGLERLRLNPLSVREYLKNRQV